ncbi:MAG TPA: MFS transporter [Bacillales bacterium]|nr:MFS transporter [Bacillales bacterium]
MPMKMSQNQRTCLILVISILFTDELLYSIIIPIIPYFSEHYQMSSSMTGLLFSSYAISSLVATPFFGMMADRFGRHAPILSGLAILLLATLLFAFSHSYTLLIVSRTIQGIGAGAAWAASLALLADLFPSELRGRAMGMAFTGISTGSLLGAPVGGFIFEFGGYQWPFLFVAGLSVLNFILFSALVPKSRVREQSVKVPMLSLLKNRAVLFIVSIILIVSTTLCLLDPILPILFSDRFQSPSWLIGLLFGGMTLANALISPVSGFLSDRYNSRSTILVGLIGIAIALPLMALSQVLWQEICAMILAGFGIGFTLSPALSHLGNAVGKDGSQAYGKTYALSDMCFTTGMVMGPLIGGVVSDIWSSGAVLNLFGIVIFLFVLGFIGTHHRSKNRSVGRWLK